MKVDAEARISEVVDIAEDMELWRKGKALVELRVCGPIMNRTVKPGRDPGRSGARGAGRKARGAGQRPPAPLTTLSATGPPAGWRGGCAAAGVCGGMRPRQGIGRQPGQVGPRLRGAGGPRAATRLERTLTGRPHTAVRARVPCLPSRGGRRHRPGPARSQ